MQTGPGPLVIEDPPPGMSCLLMVISSHGEVRSRPWLPVRLRRLSAVSWVMLRVNCYGSDHFYANYACLKVVLCPSTVTTKLPHKSQTILSSQLFWRVAFDSFPPFLSWRKGFFLASSSYLKRIFTFFIALASESSQSLSALPASGFRLQSFFGI